MNDYFKLKNKYETNNHNAKRKAFESALKKGYSKKSSIKKSSNIKNKCINCERPVGTIFSNKDRRYIATCGDKIHPCGLNIEIFRGDYVSLLDETIEDFSNIVNESKDEIIMQEVLKLVNKKIKIYNINIIN